MNLLNFISKEEIIGGLEISHDCFRFSQLNKDKSGFKVSPLIEENFSAKDIADIETIFVDKLLKFSKKNKIKYVIVSIPADNIFFKTYSFPAAMADEKIIESTRLNIELQLPKKKEDVYSDWMRIEDEPEKKVLVSCIDKTYTNNLIAKIKKAGLKIVAIESHPLSIARAIKQEKDKAVLVVEKGLRTTSFSVIKNNNLFFSQATSNEKTEKNLNIEIEKIINYQAWFNTAINSLIIIGDFKITDTKKLPLKLAPIDLVGEIKSAPHDAKWLISLGAALRGSMPREEDNIISLMELGTETAYRQEKAGATVNFLVSISIALSIFFVVAFAAVWSMIAVMQNNYNKRISAFNLAPSSENSSALKDKTDSFNALVMQISSIVKKEPYWSKVVSEVENKVTDGIIINNLALSSGGGIFSLTGQAANRESINNLKKSFETSTLFSDVNIPLNNLGKKNDISFSMTFKARNVSLIYSK